MEAEERTKMPETEREDGTVRGTDEGSEISRDSDLESSDDYEETGPVDESDDVLEAPKPRG